MATSRVTRSKLCTVAAFVELAVGRLRTTLARG